MTERKKLLTPRPWPKKPKRVRRSLKGTVALVTIAKGTRETKQTIRNARRMLAQMARRKGAITIQESGKAHRWTSETARKACFKRWRHTWLNPATGKRFVPLVKNMPLPRKELRIAYMGVVQNGVTYTGDRWLRQFRDRTWHPISEMAALVRLGYATNRHGFVPDRAVLFHSEPYQFRKGESQADRKVRLAALQTARDSHDTPNITVPTFTPKDSL